MSYILHSTPDNTRHILRLFSRGKLGERSLDDPPHTPVSYLVLFLNRVRYSNFYNPITGAVIYVLFLSMGGPLSLGGTLGSGTSYK